MTPKKIRYDKAGPKIAEALKKRHFDAYYCSTGKEATAKLLSLVPVTDVVSWGGSQTLTELGIQAALAGRGNKVLDRATAETPEEKSEITHKALLCDTFLSGTNAITEDGQLFNIDMTGNRVGPMMFGPKSVIIVSGMNKVVKTLEDAVSRARNYAAPVNSQRFGHKTPCSVTGLCADCLSPESICSYMVTMRLCYPAGRIKVILVGEDLGM